MKKRHLRMIVDTLLSILMIFEMFIQHTGILAHEIAGFALFVTLGIHLALSAGWFRGTARALERGKLTPKRSGQIVLNSLLGIDALILMVSSLAISQTLKLTDAFSMLAGYDFWFVLHAVSSRMLCALSLIHLAMHWVFIAAQLKVPFDPTRRQSIGACVGAISALGAACLSLTALQAAAQTGIEELSAAEPEAETQAVTVSERTAAIEQEVVAEPVSEQEPIAEETISEPELVVEEESTQELEQQATEDLGTCPLCHNHCPLSNHRCNKPVRAGLVDA